MYASFINTFMYIMASVFFLVVFTYIYVKLTPGDELAAVRDNLAMSPALTLCGAMIGFLLPLLSLMLHVVSLKELALWATFAGIIQLGLHAVQYRWSPMSWDMMFLRKSISPYALFCSATSVAVGAINAFALVP